MNDSNEKKSEDLTSELIAEGDSEGRETNAKPTEKAAGEPSLTTLGRGRQDSFNMPVKKSPWLIYSLLQIPLVIIFIIILYVMYQSQQN